MGTDHLGKGKSMVKRAGMCQHGGVGHLCLQPMAAAVGESSGWNGAWGRRT